MSPSNISQEASSPAPELPRRSSQMTPDIGNALTGPTFETALPTTVAPVLEITSPTTTIKVAQAPKIADSDDELTSNSSTFDPSPSPTPSPEHLINIEGPTKTTPKHVQTLLKSREVSFDVPGIFQPSSTVDGQQRQDMWKAELSRRTEQMLQSKFASETPSEIQTGKANPVQSNALDTRPPEDSSHWTSTGHSPRRPYDHESQARGPEVQGPVKRRGPPKYPGKFLEVPQIGPKRGRQRTNNTTNPSSKQSEGPQTPKRTSIQPASRPSQSRGSQVHNTITEAQASQMQQRVFEEFRHGKVTNSHPNQGTKKGKERANLDPGMTRGSQHRPSFKTIGPASPDSDNSNGLTRAPRGQRNGKSMPRRETSARDVASSSKQRHGQSPGNPRKKR